MLAATSLAVGIDDQRIADDRRFVGALRDLRSLIDAAHALGWGLLAAFNHHEALAQRV